MSGILKIEDINDKLHKYYQDGGGQTFYVGFNALANHYSIKKGGCTDWTGYPGSGKTELLLDILDNCSKWYNHKHLIYMPDAGSNEEVIAKLMHKITGKQFEKFYYTKGGEKVEIKNRITEQEMFRLLPQVLETFKIYVPEEKKDNKTRSKAVTPIEFWNFAVENRKELGVFSAVIDSWNYMKHDTEGHDREDKWLEHTLSYRNEIAERSGMHFHTIIHPKSAKKDKNGKIIMPDMHHLKGGSEWGNNGKTIIIVHRDFDSKITDIKIDKAKPRIVGVQGLASLRLDLTKSKFYENINSERHYAHQEPVVIEKKAPPRESDPDKYTTPNQGDDDDLPF
jgi:hypothetical protein